MSASQDLHFGQHFAQLLAMTAGSATRLHMTVGEPVQGRFAQDTRHGRFPGRLHAGAIHRHARSGKRRLTGIHLE